MSTDKTWFDDKLKTNLFLDVGFRAAVWLGISMVALKHATGRPGFSPAEAFKASLENLMPVVSDVLRVAIVVCAAALILKDLEHVAPDTWGQQTKKGRLGGLVRRLAGDLSTWILGALVTLLASFVSLVAYISANGGWAEGTKSFVAVMTMFFCIAIPLFAVVNVWIRRDVSLVSSHARFVQIFNTPWKVVGFYSGLALAVLVTG